MNTISHLYVLPITGPHQNKGRTCYVCQFGRAPVIVAFIKPNSEQLSKYVEYVQKMFDKWDDLKALIVVLSGPDEVIVQKLRNMADEKKLNVPVSVLDPDIGLPDTIPINLEADITLLLYRGKHFEQLGEMSPDSLPKIISFSNDTSPKRFDFINLDVDTTPQVTDFETLDIDATAGTSALFGAFDRAAEDMIKRT